MDDGRATRQQQAAAQSPLGRASFRLQDAAQSTLRVLSHKLVPERVALPDRNVGNKQQADIDDLRSATEAVQAFPIRFAGVGTFPNGTIFAAVEPSESLISLMKRTWDAFPETPTYGGEFDNPQPHLTLAKCPEDDVTTVLGQLEAQLNPILPLDFQVGSLTVWNSSSTTAG